MFHRGHYIEYHSKDHLSYIKNLGPHKWGVWFKGNAIECPPTRTVARGLMKLLKDEEQKEKDEITQTYKEVLKEGDKALKSIPGVYTLIGRLSERLERSCSRVVRANTSTQLLAAQKEAETVLKKLLKLTCSQAAT